jgi:hypothetical protein
VTPPALAVIVTGVDAVTALVAIANVALVAPCATDTPAGTVAAALLLDRETAKPPAGAGDVSETVPCDEAPPVTVAGFTATVESDADGGGAGGGVTVSVTLRAVRPNAPLIVRDVDAVTDAVLTVNVALEAPAGTVTLTGTVAAPVLLLDSVTTAPPEGAALVRLAVPSEVLPPTTLAGLSAIPASEGAWVKAPGVKRRTEDQAPAVPAELMPRTRHQCRRPALSVPAVNCDAVTIRSTTSGAEKLFESSIWMRYAVAAFTSVQSKLTGCAGVASCAGLRSVGAAGIGGGAAPVELSRTAKLGNAPPMFRTMSGFLSPLRLADRMKMPPRLDVGGGTRYCTGAWNVPSPLPFRICITPWLPSPRRKPEARVGEDQRCAERPVGVADQDRRPAPVVRYRCHEILDGVAVEVGDVEVRDRNEGRIDDGDQRRLLDERPIADAVQAVDLSLDAREGKVLEAVAVVVADGDLGHASADLDLTRGPERAVAAADHEGDHL